MSGYSMVGNGVFGGSNNFLANLGGIGQSWMGGMLGGMSMMDAWMDYQNKVAINPSYQRAMISGNVNAEGQNTVDHLARLPAIKALSALNSGRELTPEERNWLGQNGYYTGGVNNQSSVTNQQGTPQQTQVNQSPATTVAQPTQPSAPTPTIYVGNTAPKLNNVQTGAITGSSVINGNLLSNLSGIKWGT